MNDQAAISGQVVDIQNDSRHKGSIKITVHVPAEAGPHLTRVLGWPTYTNPVPIGMARLGVGMGGDASAADPSADTSASGEAVASGNNRSPINRYQQQAKEKAEIVTASEPEPPARAFTGYCREAIELCDNLEFQMFLSTDFAKTWSTAKEAVCDLTQVVSRKEIVPGSPSGDRWERLKVRFAKWRADVAENR